MKLSVLFAKIKAYFNRNKAEEDLKYKDFIENVIPSLKFGDIIYAERFNNDIEKEDMGEGHNTGPFVVISFDGDKVIGAYCTSNQCVKGGFQIGENYNLFSRDRNTYATLLRLKTIDSEAFLNIGSRNLSNSDIDRIKKKMCLTDLDIKYDDFGLEKNLDVNFNVDFEIGDVVIYSGRYYVIVEKKESTKFIIAPITGYDSRYSCIDFSQVKIDFANVKEVEMNDLFYINSIVKSQMVIIIKEYNEYIKRKSEIINSENRKLDRGCLVSLFNDLYYVYGTEGNVANSFGVKIARITGDSILIAGKRFIPCYESVKDIDIKSDSYQILGVASEEEMDEISKARKSYKKSKKEVKSNVSVKKKKMSNELLVCLKDDKKSRYIVYDENDDMYKVISLSSLLSNHEVIIFDLPKSAFMASNNVTSTELMIIKRTLEQLHNEELSNELVKKMILKL